MSTARAASAAAGPGAAPAPPVGRLGPAEVTLVEAKGSADIQGLRATSCSNFSTMRSSACVFKGRWMYEAQLGSSGIMQLGWTTLSARFNSEEGVGDNHDSYAYDGRRKQRWHVSNNAYGEQWAAGDVIGCCIDLDAGSMRFYRNGKDLGVAFTNVRRGMPGMAYFAGVSLSYSERCELNFGARPFQHPVEGYQPLHLDPSAPAGTAEAALPGGRAGQLAAARYLAGCFSRLIDVSSPAPAAASTAAEAAEAAAELGTAAASQTASEDGSSHEGGEEEGEAEPSLHEAAALLPSAPAGMGTRPSLGTTLLPDADVLAALAAAGTSKPPTRPDSAQGRPGSAGSSGPAIGIDDRILLGAVLAQHLGPLCCDPYVVEAALVPLLDDTAGDLCSSPGPAAPSRMLFDEPEGSGQQQGGGTGGGGAEGRSDAEHAAAEAPAPSPVTAPVTVAAAEQPAEELELGRQRLSQLLQLLAAVLEPEELSALVCTVCSALGRRVRGCVWSLQELPASPALAALRLWGAMLDCEDVRAAWLASGDWMQQLEALLAVRQPSEEDLTELLCNLKVSWGRDGGVVRSGREEQSTFAADLNKLTDGLEQQQQQQQQQTAEEAAEAAPESQQPAGALDVAEAAPSQHEERQSEQAAEPPPPPPPHQQEEALREEQAAAQGAPAGQESEPPGRHLREFLELLVAKNHGAMRHIPPPGLSDQTALASAVFALLRLMNEQVSAGLPAVPSIRWDPMQTFLQARLGGPLGGGEDPYWDAGRLGGTLSHVAREHPPTEQDQQPLEGLPLGAVVRYDIPLRLKARALEGPSFSDVWLRDRLLMLCHLSVAPLMRGALSHLGSMQAALAGLRAIGREAEERGGMLADTRRQCQSEFTRSLRNHEWAQCWLLSPWRQQGAFVLAVSTAQLVAAVSAQRHNLLRYVPELYCTTVLDMVHAVHRCEPPVLDHAAMLGLGLRHIVDFVVRHLEDERIVSPEVQTRLLQMVLDATSELDLLRELGQNEVARARLLPSMMRLFGRQLLWGPVSNFFALLVEGQGFLHPPPAFPSDFVEPLARLRGMFKQACLGDAELCGRFLHHLFTHLNAMLTELVASLEGLDSSWSRAGGGPSPQLLRLLTSTADYTLVLLRTLELMAGEMPQLFLEGSDMNVTRLAGEHDELMITQNIAAAWVQSRPPANPECFPASPAPPHPASTLPEVLGFAVPQFVSGKAHRALQRVAANRPMAHQLRLREAHLLQDQPAPAAERAGAEPAGQPARRQSLVAALNRQAALTSDVLLGLLEAELHQAEPLSGDASAAEEQGLSPREQRRGIERQLQQLRSAIDAVLDSRAGGAGGASGSGSAGGGTAADLADAPDEFLDPILMTLMQDPVTLPDSRVTIDRPTIERHLLSSQTDPFSRAPLTKDQLVPDAELRARIEAWLAGHGSQQAAGEQQQEAAAAAGAEGTAAAQVAAATGQERAAVPTEAAEGEPVAAAGAAPEEAAGTLQGDAAAVGGSTASADVASDSSEA
ncbi:hypothetical protein COHA_004350 [Chlorella ohadii]|uniref:RING-type E3 ubiquitin transferase n=1 Tax=Chlorella ohadii TaxID=2649997 RepID=A0AAD5H2U4_9CHLO|nr:hypothetical protein COHA_004350 [Chlorella ohadii]